MSDKSHIGWTDATWNPVTGCTKVSQGCKHCYAEREWKRLSANPKTVYYGRPFTDVQCHPERLVMPLRWRKPRRIFVNAMSDLFHEDVPNDFIAAVFGIMSATPRHRYQILTKRPERMLDIIQDMQRPYVMNSDVPANCRTHTAAYIGLGWRRQVAEDIWPLPNVELGISAEDQQTFDDRILPLLETPAAYRIVSLEPLLGPINLIDYLRPPPSLGRVTMLRPGEWGVFPDRGDTRVHWSGLHGVIAGGESGKGARPMDKNWVRSIRDQCHESGVPFFFKQWGEWVPVFGGQPGIRSWRMACVGKKRAGNVLDGVTHEELPA